jgi:hypothetical protein
MYEALMEGTRSAQNTFVGKPEGKRPLEKSRRIWKDEIRMDLREVVSKFHLESCGFE